MKSVENRLTKIRKKISKKVKILSEKYSPFYNKEKSVEKEKQFNRTYIQDMYLKDVNQSFMTNSFF